MMSIVVVCEEEDIQAAIEALNTEILNKQCLLNVEYKSGLDHVTLCHVDSKDDVAQALIADGLVLAEPRREKRLSKLVSQYQKAEEKAKEGRVCNNFIDNIYFSGLCRLIQIPSFPMPCGSF